MGVADIEAGAFKGPAENEYEPPVVDLGELAMPGRVPCGWSPIRLGLMATPSSYELRINLRPGRG